MKICKHKKTENGPMTIGYDSVLIGYTALYEMGQIPPPPPPKAQTQKKCPYCGSTNHAGREECHSCRAPIRR